MNYFTRKASKEYYLLSRKAYISGLVGWAHFLDRTWLARELTRDRDPVHFQANRLLLAEEDTQDSQWTDEEYDDLGEMTFEVVLQEDGINEGGEDDSPLLLIAKVNGLEEWHFHQYDDDFFPSVPHGHWLNKKSPKLDSYLGWVYEGTRQIRRMRRSLIVDLWNNQEFRLFASTAIDYYLAHHSSYNGWRVSNPKKLPARR